MEYYNNEQDAFKAFLDSEYEALPHEEKEKIKSAKWRFISGYGVGIRLIRKILLSYGYEFPVIRKKNQVKVFKKTPILLSLTT